MYFPPASDALIAEAVDHALATGLVMRGVDGAVEHAPFTLFPSPYPRAAYQRAWALADDFNRLFAAFQRDPTPLEEEIATFAAADPFTGQLFARYQSARRGDYWSAPTLGLFRSDYLLQANEVEPARAADALRQVEINTVSSAFAALGSQISLLHHYLASRHAGVSSEQLPPNRAQQGFTDALASAWHHYHQRHGLPSGSAALLFVVQPGERNRFDQRLLELRLWQAHSIPVLRRTLSELHEQQEVRAGDGALLVEGREIAVTYFRAGYRPEDFPSELEWSAREQIERSRSYASPDLLWQLAGSKKIQQRLAEPGGIERWVDPATTDRLRSCFATLAELEEQRVNATIASPDEWVLKPQREGGGNNLFGTQISEALSHMARESWPGWILMERIRAPQQPAVLLRNGVASSVAAVSELGIFSTCLVDQGELLQSRAVGHLLRSKPANIDEGGVAAGAAFLDSPVFVTPNNIAS